MFNMKPQYVIFLYTQVETVGESYMISCGVPYPTENHAEYLADTLLSIISEMTPMVNTLIPEQKTEIKIGT